MFDDKEKQEKEEAEFKEKELKRKEEMKQLFLNSYKQLTVDYKLDFMPYIDYTPQGAIAKVAIVELK